MLNIVGFGASILEMKIFNHFSIYYYDGGSLSSWGGTIHDPGYFI